MQVSVTGSCSFRVVETHQVSSLCRNQRQAKEVADGRGSQKRRKQGLSPWEGSRAATSRDEGAPPIQLSQNAPYELQG